MLAALVLIIVGFILLVLGAEGLVRGASAMAKHLRIQEMVIGLTVVAFGTSAPEFIVNIIASAGKDEGIVIGNILGSNIFNLLVILGVGGLIWPMRIYRKSVQLELPFAFFAVLMIGFAANDIWLDGATANLITRSDALQMLSVFAVFLIFNFGIIHDQIDIDLGVKQYQYWAMAALILGGSLLLFAGGKLVVQNAVQLAKSLGVSEMMIGLTIVSIGTSLPELATTIVAALRRRSNIAIGNVVGSNIFNALFILPMSTFFGDIPYPAGVNVDLAVLAAASAFVYLSMIIKKRHRFGRWQATVLLVAYGAYVVFVVGRG